MPPTCWIWPAENFEPCHAMRQQEKQKQQKDQENRKQNLWARQYSDDVFIEDPLPTIKPRWGEIELYNQILLFDLKKRFAHVGFIFHCVLDKYDRQHVITIHFRVLGVWVVPHHKRDTLYLIQHGILKTEIKSISIAGSYPYAYIWIWHQYKCKHWCIFQTIMLQIFPKIYD